ncbi:hypothetical protein METBIDRAFT_38028 [Metschnikowia bicuspidata var. bicuspidata NRRL YB-4993]|uniref:PHD-type domain-containing protein n=1 Tax=Metschnikowia bicuspidata var. bicuspidata NRRL YB-4993 TaxID=869754 RepID=A0A1A0HHA4_9ASCO|nr:hypothetical protein METBIDRAFT_38028 [Metschnikowia bicuspidata var. bicuspidata NRRL YB-4993]OBA23380.1 hypothetical protein METBIDRAFT_38028 [Metschnikowia bicuspidata var. bicuspidata NRRL YB-4993]
MDGKHDFDLESDGHKRKSKSPSLSNEHEPKRPKLESDDWEKLEDIAKQYKKFVAAPKFSLNSEELFCVCRKPDSDGELMISCDGCEEWFHTKCMRIDPEYTQLLDKFFCKFCQWKGSGVTRWNRKCRMLGCLKPIRATEKSKYCSDECGEAFMLLKLSGSQVLTLSDLNFVVNYCGSYAELNSMGSTFPELPEVLLLDMEKLPELVQKVLTDNEEMQEKIQAQLEQNKAKTKYLSRVKEMVAIINEEILALAAPSHIEETAQKSKKKKSRSIKIDLCCFQCDLNTNLFQDLPKDKSIDTDVRVTFEEEITYAVEQYNAGPDFHEGKMCLKDRRKCLRHNGWFNLLSDRLWKRLEELQTTLDKLQKEKSVVLRNYSISVYERQL